MSIILEIAGVKWTAFIDINVSIAIDNLSGTFNFKTVVKDGEDFPFSNGSTIRIYADNTQILDGYIEYISGERSADGHTIEVSGRDKTCDIIDSSLGGNLSFKENSSLAEIAQKILDQLSITNIKIIQEVAIDRFQKGDITSAEVGENAFEFLEKYARKRQILLTTDGKGNLVFTRASTNMYATKLVMGNNVSNIKKTQAVWDNSKQFYKYIVVCQGNASSAGVDENAYFKPLDDANIFKIAYNSDIRKSRVQYFNAETSMTPENAQKRVVWQAKVNRGKAFKYTCEVQGFTAQLDNKIWRPNVLVTVIDPFQLVKSQLLISSVSYTFNINEGSKTVIELITKDAFSAEHLEDRGQKEKKKKDEVSKEGEAFAGVNNK
jgi:prophage tail gpP-like protein